MEEQREGKVGKVYLVGAGPGDAGLITVKGLRCLQEADAVVYDRLVGQQIIQMIKPKARKIYVGKRPDLHAMKQDHINELLAELALEGLNVVRLKGGDPCVFGRVGEEAALLKQHSIPYEIVPGVTSAVAVPAYAGIPVTHRNRSSSFTVITGHEKQEFLEEMISWEGLAKSAGTVIFLMGIGSVRLIANQLIRYGRSSETPVALIRWGTLAEQMTITGTLGSIADEVERMGFSSPAVIIVGDVVLEREMMQWAELRPLFGKRILITRAREQSSSFVRAIEDLGGEPYEYPVIETRMPEPADKIQAISDRMNELQRYQWLLLTSTNGVRYWIEHMRLTHTDVRCLAGIRIVAVGPKTAEALQEYGIIPDITAKQFSQEGLWTLLAPELVPGQRALLARGDLSRPWLGQRLREAGVIADELDIYETILPEQEDPRLMELLREGRIHYVPFTSASTVTNLLALLHRQGADNAVELLNRCQLICIGDITARAAREAGLRVDAVAEQSTMDGVMQELLRMSLQSQTDPIL